MTKDTHKNEEASEGKLGLVIKAADSYTVHVCVVRSLFPTSSPAADSNKKEASCALKV